MSVTYWEMFTGQDWESAANTGGKVSCLSCIVVAIVSMALSFSLDIGIWTLFVGLLIATWELPVVYSMFARCEEVKTIALDRVYIKHPLVKGFVYVLLSILCYEKKTLCIIAGIVLNLESMLLVFAYINQRVDASDGGLTTDEDLSPAEAGRKLLSSQKFGTF